MFDAELLSQPRGDEDLESNDGNLYPPPKTVYGCEVGEAGAEGMVTPEESHTPHGEQEPAYKPQQTVYFRCSYCLHHRTTVPHYSANKQHRFCTFNCLSSFNLESRRKSVEILVTPEQTPDGDGEPTTEEVLLPPLETDDDEMAAVFMKRKRIEGLKSQKPEVKPGDVLNLYKAIADSPLGSKLAAHMKSNNEHREKMSAMMADDLHKAKNHGIAVSESRIAQLEIAADPLAHVKGRLQGKRASLGALEDVRTRGNAMENKEVRLIRRASGTHLPSMGGSSSDIGRMNPLGRAESYSDFEAAMACPPPGGKSRRASMNPDSLRVRKLSVADSTGNAGGLKPANSRRQSSVSQRRESLSQFNSLDTTRQNSHSNFMTTRRPSLANQASSSSVDSRRGSISAFRSANYSSEVSIGNTRQNTIDILPTAQDIRTFQRISGHH